MLFVACASIAGIEAPELAEANGSATTGNWVPGSSSGSDGNTILEPGQDAGARSEEDKDADAPTVAPDQPPAWKSNGETCASAGECSSNACGQQKTCVDACKTTEQCSGPQSEDCCVGLYCGNDRACKPCYGAGLVAPKTGPVWSQYPNARACCSGELNPEDKTKCL